MGLEQNTNAVYLSIGDGKITKRVKTPTATSVTRTTKEGKLIYEEIYDAVTAVITDIKIQDHPQYGRFWNIHLHDGAERFILQMNYSSSYSAAFLKILPNVDITSLVRIIPTMKIVEGKKKPGLFISQHGTALKHFYTRDNPNGLPPLQKIKVKKQGKLTEAWDDNAMMEFLENMVNTDIIPKLRKEWLSAATYPPGVALTITDANNITEPDEDLPF